MGLKEKLRYIDPFYLFDVFWERYVGLGGWVKTVADIIFTLFIAFLIYAFAGFLLGTSKPAVIVASSSMIPTLYPGDIVIVRGINPARVHAPEVYVNTTLNYHVLPQDLNIHFIRKGIELVSIRIGNKVIPVEKNGTIIVYHDDLKNRDIIHRVILKIKTPAGYFYVTKGDNDNTNPTADQDCVLGGCVYPFLVSQKQVIGTPVFVIPRIGMVKLMLFPW